MANNLVIPRVLHRPNGKTLFSYKALIEKYNKEHPTASKDFQEGEIHKVLRLSSILVDKARDLYGGGLIREVKKYCSENKLHPAITKCRLNNHHNVVVLLDTADKDNSIKLSLRKYNDANGTVEFINEDLPDSFVKSISTSVNRFCSEIKKVSTNETLGEKRKKLQNIFFGTINNRKVEI